MSPVIFQKSRLVHSPATAKELAEYAVLLHRIGLHREPFDILRAVSANDAPEKILFEAFCHFRVWDFAAAKTALELHSRYETDEEQRLLGRLNLAAAQVGLGECEGALDQLNQLQVEAKSRGNRRMEMQIQELWAQVMIQQNRFDDASMRLDLIQSFSRDAFGVESRFARKWWLILSALREGSTEPFSEMRQFARQAFDWEMLREADLYEYRIKPSQRLLDRLYFGTPHSAYRARLLAMGSGMQPSENFLITRSKTRPSEVIRLSTGRTLSNDKRRIPPGTLHRFFIALNQDLYAPTAIPEIFARVFHDERFHPETSVNRVHQLVHRVKGFISDSGLDLELSQRRGLYRLRPGLNLGLEFDLGAPSSTSLSDQERRVTDRLVQAPQKASELREALHLSRMTLHRVLSALKHKGLVRVLGSGRDTQYELIVPKT
jgi:predicted negative regulator of RcsB-dependent stress response/DNA-binding transcriptional ArsR family regulator